MKLLYYLAIIISLLGCSKAKEFALPILISVEPGKESIFGSKDSRYLVINDSHGINIDKIRLRDNVDSDAKSFLFKPNKNFVLVDCDGVWYNINYETGDISKDSNHNPWVKKILPTNYVGTFMQRETKNIYFLKKETKINMNEVYKYGGG